MLSVRIENCATHQSVDHSFHRSPVRVGRNALNELTLNEGYVSLSHAVLRFDEEKIQIIDLGSTNGTLVDGARIESNVPVTVKEGSDVRIGELRFHFSRGVTSKTPVPGRDRTQFRLATQDFRAAASPTPVERPAAPGARVPAPPTLFVPSLASVPRTGQTPKPAPAGPSDRGASPSLPPATPLAPARPTVSPPGAPAQPSRVAVAEFPPPPDPNATVLDVDLRAALEPDPLAGAIPLPPVDPSLMDAVLQATYPAYVEYRKAWRKFHDALQHKAGHLPLASRLALSEELEQQMPALYQEEQFRAFAGKPPLATLSETTVPAGQPGGTETDRLLSVFAQTYSARPVALNTPQEVDTFLDRLADLLETFATSFIELRRGQAEFGNQIAVRTVTADTLLRRARSPKELLHLLFDTAQSGDLHLDDLKAGFGEVMFHQVAFLSGTREGVKALLEELDPAQLVAEPRGAKPSLSGRLMYLWPAVLWTRWRRFWEVWKGLGEEEHALRILFGPEFARAYALVMGGQLGPGKSGRPNPVSQTKKTA